MKTNKTMRRYSILICILLAAGMTQLGAEETELPSSQTLQDARPKPPVTISQPTTKLNEGWTPDPNPEPGTTPVGEGAIILSALAIGYALRKRK